MRQRGEGLTVLLPLALVLLLAVLFAVVPGLKAWAATEDIMVTIQGIQPYGDDEIVTIVNSGSVAVDLSGWRLESSNARGQDVQETFWFPTGCRLPAGGVLRVHSGPYAHSWGEQRCGYAQIDLAWTTAKVWSDAGDVAWLRDSFGDLVDLYTYGTRPSEEARVPKYPLFYWPGRAAGSGAATRATAGTSGCGPGTPTPSGGSGATCAERRPRCPSYSCWSGKYANYTGCCAVKVYLESIEPVYNHGVGCNWRFFVDVAGAEPLVFPNKLPQLLYSDVLRGPGITLQVGADVVEQDLWPDWGHARRVLHLCCPESPTTQEVALLVHIKENECPNAGRDALWRFVFKIELEPRGPFVPGGPAAPTALQPQARFTITPAGPYKLGQEVTLDASPSRGSGLRYEWDLDNDGHPDASGARVTYVLNKPGGNLITLTVSDAQGSRSTVTYGLRVPPGAAPVISPSTALGEADPPGDPGPRSCGLLWLALPVAALGGLLLLLLT